MIFTPQLVLQAIKDLLPERNVSAGRNTWQRPKVGDIEAEDVSRNGASEEWLCHFDKAKHVGRKSHHLSVIYGCWLFRFENQIEFNRFKGQLVGLLVC